MNVTVRLTLDGMIRALRWRLHALAEDGGRGYAPRDRDAPDEPRRPDRQRETDDVVSRE